MIKKKIMVILVICCFLLTNLATVPAVEIEERITEKTFNLIVPEKDFLIERDETISTLDEIGEIKPMWVETWKVADEGNDHGKDIAIDEKYDYIYVSGYGQSLDDRLFYNFLLQYDIGGELQWYKILSKDDIGCGTNVCVDNDGYVYVSYVTQGGNILLLSKYDRYGNEEWPEPKVCMEVGYYEFILTGSIVTDGSFIYMTAECYGDISILKSSINWDDDCQIIATWSGSQSRDVPRSIIIHGNYIYVAGVSSSDIDDYCDAIILKYDTNGDLQWNVTLRENQRNGVRSMMIHDNNIYVTGVTGILHEHFWVFLMKYDLDGNQLWSEPVTWKHPEDWSQGDAMTIDGGYIFIAGELNDFINSDFSKDSALLLRYDLNGSFDFAKTWIPTKNGIARANDIESFGECLYITGTICDVYLLKCNYEGDRSREKTVNSVLFKFLERYPLLSKLSSIFTRLLNLR